MKWVEETLDPPSFRSLFKTKSYFSLSMHMGTCLKTLRTEAFVKSALVSNELEPTQDVQYSVDAE